MQEKIKEYLDWKGTYAPSASVSYKLWLSRFAEICGHKPLNEYQISDIVKFKLWVESHYSPYSVHYSIVVIKNFFKFFRDQNYTCISPSFIKSQNVHPNSYRAITENEYMRIIERIPVNNFRSLRDLLVIRLLWETGVRVSELCNLSTSKINENSRSCVIYTKKNGQPRIIVWSEETHYSLIKYLSLRKNQKNAKNNLALFISQKPAKSVSRGVNSKTVLNIIKKYAGKAGICENISPHCFRHGWAHKRRDQNATLAFIQKGLGHVNPSSTFIYEQYNDREFVKYADMFLKPA